MNGPVLLQSSRAISAIVVLCAIVLLLTGPSAQARSSGNTLATDSQWTPLELSVTDTRYSLASLDHSSGFVPVPDNLALEDALGQPPQDETFGLTPNFREYSRYWLYTNLRNRSDNRDWMLHISNFGFLDPRVLVQGEDGQVIRTFSNNGYQAGTDINTIGRAVRIQLEPGQDYRLVVELTAYKAAWQPYIGLMSDHYYQGWKITQDLAYKTAVGIILGFILLGLTCWLVTWETPFWWATLSALLMLVYHLEHSSLPALLWQSSYEKNGFFWALMFATMLSQLAFAGSFLGIRRGSGRWYYAFAGAMVVTAILAVASQVLSFEANMRLAALNYLVVAVVVLGSGVCRVRSEGSYYFIYLLGWFPMVLSILQVAWVVQGPGSSSGEITASYKMIHVVYIQILHLLLHAVALVLRLRALRREKLKAEFLSLAKSRFIAQSSHDLAQPLHSMSVFLEYLKPYVQGQQGQKIFHRLRHTHRQMNESFRAIMDLGKLESGVIRAEPRAVRLSDQFSRLEQDYRVLAREKGLQLSVCHCSLTVFSDPVLLERLLRNLLSNAIKYTDQGKVLVGCRRQGQAAILQVLDTGCGITDHAREQIFDIYHRSAGGDTVAEGSGIGLSIVRHLADRLDHPLSLASIPGRGSRFSVTVPLLNEGATDTKPLRQAPAPVVALAFTDRELVETVSGYLRRWQQTPVVFDSLGQALGSDAAITVLLCDQDSLEGSMLSMEQARSVAQSTALACVCKPGTPLPEPWTALSPHALPVQLRALLNTAGRRQPATAACRSAGIADDPSHVPHTAPT